LPGAFGVVRDRLDRVVVPGETGRYGRVGELVGAVVWAVDDRLTVYCHGDRAAHAHVLELFNALVEGEVEDRQLIDGLELVRVLRIVYHVQQERRGDAGNVEVASVELLPGDERVRDDAVVDAVDVRPTGEVALVGGQVEAGVAYAVGQHERSGADRVVRQVLAFAEFAGHVLGHDARGRHGEVVQEHRVRRVERDADGEVVYDLDAR